MLVFNPLRLDDRSQYLQKYAAFQPYADYYFNNLFSWLGTKDTVHLAYHGDGIVIKFINPFNDETTETYTVIAHKSAPEIVRHLFEVEKVKNLEMVPAITRDALLDDIYCSQEFSNVLDRDNCDYVYDAQALAHMLGPKSKGFLRQVNKFLKRHSSEVVVKPINLKDHAQKVMFVNQIHVWEKLYTKNDLDRSEATALENYMRHAEFLHPECIGIYIDGKLEAFSIYAYPPQEDFMILSHAKSSYAFPGLFDFLVYVTVSRAVADKNIKYMNFEQDLGIEGLRQHKTLMQPIYMLEKFTVEPVSHRARATTLI